MGLSASQGRLLLLTERKSDLEFRAQQISQQRLVLSQQLESISREYEQATSNRQMLISVTDSEGQTSSRNLTYALLISGTLNNITNSQSGISGSTLTKTDRYTTSNYRLVNVDGAIIVGSEKEIPTSITSTKTDEKTLNSDTDLAKLYSTNGNKISKTEYCKYTEKTGNSDTIHNCVKVTYTDSAGETRCGLYDVDSGKCLAEDNADTKITTALDKGEGYEIKTDSKNNVIVTHTYSQEVKTSEDGELPEPDSNGVYTVGDRRYVVDPILLKGGTGSSDPNYLQDCLRNGKYLIQKGSKDVDENEFLWKDVSWDAVSAISDRYYTDDDDVAKAKYDRLQSEIQNQDKKLELELNNIETQRSAVDTEIESVQKVIDDNVQASFKVFNA